MMRRRKIKSCGFAELRGAAMHVRSGFEIVSSNSRLALRRRRTRNVSEAGMYGLRWYNLTGTLRRALERKLRRDIKQPRNVRMMRKRLPLKARHPKVFQLY